MSAPLVFLFGSREILGREKIVDQVRAAYPGAHFIGCSTGGEIFGATVSDQSLVATAVEFAHTPIQVAATRITNAADSYEAGRRLAQRFNPEGLSHLLVLTEGIFLYRQRSASRAAWPATGPSSRRRCCSGTTRRQKRRSSGWGFTAIA
jgi:hypothetical protein